MSKTWELSANKFVLKDPSKDFYIVYQGDNGPLRCLTELVDKDNNHYVLNGDFRKEYEYRFDKGYGECKKYFKKMKDGYRSLWSD